MGTTRLRRRVVPIFRSSRIRRGSAMLVASSRAQVAGRVTPGTLATDVSSRRSTGKWRPRS